MIGQRITIGRKYNNVATHLSYGAYCKYTYSYYGQVSFNMNYNTQLTTNTYSQEYLDSKGELGPGLSISDYIADDTTDINSTKVKVITHEKNYYRIHILYGIVYHLIQILVSIITFLITSIMVTNIIFQVI